MNQPTFAPADDETADLLGLISADYVHQLDRDKVDAAITQTARDNGGRIDANKVRALLVNERGHLTVYPRLLSARYSVLARTGVIKADGWTTNTDTVGRNSGRPCRVWRLVGEL